MIIDKMLTYTSEIWIVTKIDRKEIHMFERKVYRGILGPVYGNEKENWRILFIFVLSILLCYFRV
jgi:hypothetical protein